jgi:rubrerythrin
MYDLLADVKLSIELEEKGHDFYVLTAAKTRNPLAVATLSGLAEREQEHIRRISEFYGSLTGGRKLEASWLTVVQTPPDKKALLEPILKKLKDNLNQKFETEADINEAYKIAEGLETDSFVLYDKIARETTDPTAKKFYAALASEEREHYDILEDTLRYLNDPGDWYREQERWIVEG